MLEPGAWNNVGRWSRALGEEDWWAVDASADVFNLHAKCASHHVVNIFLAVLFSFIPCAGARQLDS